MQDCLLRRRVKQHKVKQHKVKQHKVKQHKAKARVRNKNRLLATHAVQAETIGNLNIPAELDYSVKIKNVIYRVKQCLYKLFHFGKIHNSPAFPIGKFFDMVGVVGSSPIAPTN